MAITRLEYDSTSRIWLKEDGFDRLHQFIHSVTEQIYPISVGVAPYQNAAEYVVYDLANGERGTPSRNIRHFSGRTSLFCSFLDFRLPPLMHGQPERLDRTVFVSKTTYSEWEKSKEYWYFSVHHVFEREVATSIFRYVLPSSSCNKMYPLFDELGISRVRPGDGPPGVSIGLFPEQWWDDEKKRWRGVGYLQKRFLFYRWDDAKPVLLY